MQGIETILCIILIVINWILYHKFFQVTYFGSVGKQIFREIVIAFLVAVVEMVILGQILGAVGGILMATVSIVGKIIIFIAIIVVIALCVLGLYRMIVSIKERKGENFQNRKDVDIHSNVSQNFSKENMKDQNLRENRNKKTESFMTKEGEKTRDTVANVIKQAEENHNTTTLQSGTMSNQENNSSEKQEEKQIYCCWCGKRIAAGSKFCKYCGNENSYKV